MERTIFTLSIEPTGMEYRAILDACIRHCSAGLLVERPSLGMSEQGKLVIEKIRPWIREEKHCSEWPGTKLYGHTALVRVFAFDRDSARVLQDSADSLYQWQQPALPEDLCLLRPDGDPWLVSISHERDAYMKISEDERNYLARSVPELTATLRYS